jgi:hypothetical protein
MSIGLNLPAIARYPGQKDSFFFPATANLALDFQRDVYVQSNASFALSTILATTRSIAEAVASDNAGNLWGFAPNIARRTDQGLLTENSDVSVLPRSEDLAGWPAVTGAATATNNVATVPITNGTPVQLARVTRGASSASFRGQSYTKGAAAVINVTLDGICGPDTGDFLAVRAQGTFPNKIDVCINTRTGVFAVTPTVAGGNFVALSSWILPLGNTGYFYYWVSFQTDNAAGLAYYISPRATSGVIDATDINATASVIVGACTFKEKTYKSSYIKVPSTTAITRDKDIATVNNVGTWYNTTEGTFVIQLKPLAVDSAVETSIFSLQDATLDNFLRLSIFNNQIRFLVRAATVSICVLDTGASLALDRSNTIAVSYKNNEYKVSVNGGPVFTSGGTTLPTTMTAFLLSGGGFLADTYAYYEGVAYVPTASTDAVLQAYSRSQATFVAPPDLSGLQLWLDTSDLSTITKDGSDKVSAFVDKSGNGLVAAQAIGARQPVYQPAGLNGRPTMLYANAQLEIPDNVALDYTVGTTIFIVSTPVDNVAASGGGVIFAKWGAGGNEYDITYANQAVSPVYYFMAAGQFVAATTTTLEAVTGQACVLCHTQANGVVQTMQKNGGAEYNSVATISRVNGTEMIRIGTIFTTDISTKISEIVMYSRNLSTIERAQVNSYLKVKWGIA